jgi:kynurenine formamidase
MTSELGNGSPSYDELPLNEKLGLRSAWTVWGEGNQLGTINRIDEACVRAATQEVQDGTVFSLSLPLSLPAPPLFGREVSRHEVFAIDRNTQDDYLDRFFLQSSSHWDSLLHVRAREFGYYGGFDSAAAPVVKSGIAAWAAHGIVTRGVLLDVVRYRLSIGQPITPMQEASITATDLQETAASQRVELRQGDILLIRTGWMENYMMADSDTRSAIAASAESVGLAADEAMARFLWDCGAAAVVTDNPTFEVFPGSASVGSLHRRLLPMLGFAIGELWNLESLADASQDDGRYCCLVASAPLNLVGGTGSPANAVAVR